MTTTPAGIQANLDWHKAHVGKISYSESASTRLNHKTLADLNTPTDCSGDFIRTTIFFCKVDLPATYTGNLITHGVLVTQSKSAARAGYGMLPGDGVLFDFAGAGRPTHIALYAGGGRIWNHGGPGKGPLDWSLASNVDNAHQVWVRRYVTWPKATVTHPAVVSKTPSNPMHGKPIPALIARGTGDYYGLVTGPNESHGGAYSTERPAIELIQSFLNWKLKSGLKVDGIFGATTRTAVIKFQAAYMKGVTSNPGEFWYDDWAKASSL